MWINAARLINIGLFFTNESFSSAMSINIGLVYIYTYMPGAFGRPFATNICTDVRVPMSVHSVQLDPLVL